MEGQIRPTGLVFATCGVDGMALGAFDDCYPAEVPSLVNTVLNISAVSSGYGQLRPLHSLTFQK